MGKDLTELGDVRDEEHPRSCCGNRCALFPCCNTRISIWKCKRVEDTCLMWSVIGLVVSLIVSLALPPILARELNNGVNEQVVMTPNNPNLQAFTSNIQASDTQIQYDLTFFNITNPEEMMAGGKPTVNPIGPYSYNEYFQKFDMTWSADEETITYNRQRFFVWAGESRNEGLSQDDELILVNPVVIAMEFLLSKISANITAMIEVTLEKELEIYYSKVQEGIQKAYDEIDARRLLPAAQKQKLEKQLTTIQNELALMNSQLEDFVSTSNPFDLVLKLLLAKSPYGLTPFTKQPPGPAYFGWLNDPILMEVQKMLDLVAKETNITIPFSTAVPGSVSNDTSIESVRQRRGRTTLQTGKSDAKQVGTILISDGMTSVYGCVNPMASQNLSQYIPGVDFPSCEVFDLSWNESTIKAKGYNPAWATAEANLISGRYGNGELFARPLNPFHTPVYVGDVFRGVPLEHASTQDWYGVDVSRLQISNVDMQNSSVVPANGQYYSDGPMGLINLTSAMGAPSFGSYPHFLLADPRLLDAVNGLDPNYDLHSTWMDVEPYTGLLARARKQMQTNFYLKAQNFPLTKVNFKYEASELCQNVSQVLTELKQDPLPCGQIPQVDELFDMLAMSGGWKLYQNGVDGGSFVPYGYSCESMALPQSDADAIISSVYLVQNLETYTFQGGLIASGVFFVMIISLVWLRIRRGEMLTDILCGTSKKNTATMDKVVDVDKNPMVYQNTIHSPLVRATGSANCDHIRDSQI